MSSRRSRGRWQAVTPIVPARSIDGSCAFYRDMLGFSVVHTEDGYGIVGRDDIHIHFWGPSGIDPAASDTMIRIAVDDIDAIHDEVEPQGIIHENAPLHETEWGTREFAIRDCDGHLITFVQPA